MSESKNDKLDEIRRYAHILEVESGKAVRPYREDGFVNLLNRYGTESDTTEHYEFVGEATVPDETLTNFYEGNGLFAKIIDAPAEEAVKHGFELDGIEDHGIIDFCTEALDELDWEETAMTALKWQRLFGGSIAVLLVNDGGALEDPLNWRGIKSIDDIRVYERAVVTPDYNSVFSYDPQDPFRTRGSRLGMPEYYNVTSMYGSFTVHESRCLTFLNGKLPENSSNSIYQFWGIPEYLRIHRAIRDAEIAHGSATKLLDRSVQAVYKMHNLSSELSTEEGEDRVLRRLRTIDMARGLLNSITIDAENEDYDFKSFQFAGVSDVVDCTCNFLSALTSIPQTILFGRSPAGMNSTGTSDLENWYNYVERIQKRSMRSNLRYLLSIILQAGKRTGEIDEIPKIKIKFNPLWSLSDNEQADLEQKKAQTQLTKAQTAQAYVDMQAIDPQEVRNKLAESEEFDVESMLDDIDEEDLYETYLAMEQGKEGDEEQEAGAESGGGNSPDAAPAATKLPQDMNNEETEEASEAKEELAEEAEAENISNTEEPENPEDEALKGDSRFDKSKKDGGPGSGNFGHKGIPGQIGGSAPSGESNTTPSKSESPRKYNSEKIGKLRGSHENASKDEIDTYLGMAGANELDDGTGFSYARVHQRFGETAVHIVNDNQGEASIVIKPEDKEVYIDTVVFAESGKGKGTRFVQNLVSSAREQGMKKLSLFAMKSGTMNGYYSWAALGFDAPIPDEVKGKAEAEGIKAKTVQELMDTGQGRLWWKENGVGCDMTFDLSEESSSSKALDKVVSKLSENRTDGGKDGGPGSGNYGHEGRPGEIGGSIGTLGESAQKSKDVDSFVSDHSEELMEKGIDTYEGAVKYWKDSNYAKDYHPHALDDQEAVDLVREEVPNNILDGWFVNADSRYKGKLEELALSNDDVRNAGLNIAYRNYKEFTGDEDITFEEFLDTEITVYRGKDSEHWVEGDDIVSFSYDKKIAEKFGSNVVETKIKPSQTIGSYQTTAENEIFVRRSDVDAPGYNDDAEEAALCNPRRKVILAIKEGIVKDGDPGSRNFDGSNGAVGVVVVKDGKILTGTRLGGYGAGEICGPGGHIEYQETPAHAALRETEEEFGIILDDLYYIGRGPEEVGTGMAPYLFLSTSFTGEPVCESEEMKDATFRTLDELSEMENLFVPFESGINALACVLHEDPESIKMNISENPIDKSAQSVTIKSKGTSSDGGPGSGNFGHKGVPGQIGGSAPGNGSTSLGSSASPKAQKIYDKAVESEKKITPVLKEIAESIDSHLEGLEFSVKSPESVMGKIERKVFDAKKKKVELTQEDAIKQMGDLVRYTAVGTHDGLASTTKRAIKALEDKGYKVVKVENKYLHPEFAYKGIHLDVVSPEGQRFELQVHSKESLEIKNKIHPYFEEYRKTTTPKKRKAELDKKMKEISSVLPAPKDIESIEER